MIKAPISGPVDPIPTIIPTPVEYQIAGASGTRVLWVVFAIMLIASAVFTGLSWKVPIAKRLFHVITTLITVVAALSYYAMATSHGQSLSCTRVWDHHDNVPDTSRDVCRETYFARYIDWAITTPLLLLDLCILGGISGGNTLIAIVADIIMILTGLFAAYGGPSPDDLHPGQKYDLAVYGGQKWGWYTIACLAYLVVVWHVGIHGYRATRAKGGVVARTFAGLAPFTFVLWTAYPIVWAFADGARKTTVFTEIVIYAILDVLAKVGFGTWLLGVHRRNAELSVDVGGWWANGLDASSGRILLGEDDA